MTVFFSRPRKSSGQLLPPYRTVNWTNQNQESQIWQYNTQLFNTFQQGQTNYYNRLYTNTLNVSPSFPTPTFPTPTPKPVYVFRAVPPTTTTSKPSASKWAIPLLIFASILALVMGKK